MKCVSKVVSWCVGAFLAGNVLAGTSYTWTGAVDGHWTNAANWVITGTETVPDVCPGVVSNATGDATFPCGLVSGDATTFGAVASGGATTIDFDGLFSVGSMTFLSGAPAYTLGVDGGQYVPIEGKGTFDVQAGAATPIFVAAFSPQANAYNASRGDIKIYNNSSAPLAFARFGRIIPRPGVKAGGTTTTSTEELADWLCVVIEFYGTGGFTFTEGSEAPGCNWWFNPKLACTGPVRICKDFKRFQRLYTAGSGTVAIEIDEGASLWPRAANNTCGCTFDASVTRVFGKGRIVFRDNVTANNFSNRGTSTLGSNDRVIIECGLDARCYSSDAPGGLLIFDGADTATNFGKRRFYFPVNDGVVSNAMTGKVVLNHPLAMVFTEMSQFGNMAGFIVSHNDSGVLYEGTTNMTYTVPMVITNGTRAVVANDSTATLTVGASFAAEQKAGATVMLDARQGPITFAGTLEAGDFAVTPCARGTYAVTIAADVEFPAGGEKVGLAGSTIALPGRTTFGALEVMSGVNMLTLTAGQNLTVANVTRSSGSTGTLNVVLNGGTFKVTNLAGTTPEWLIITKSASDVGYAAAAAADGTLVAKERAFTLTHEIAAKGDQVPNAETAVVGITSAGSGADDTLAADATAVNALVQKTAADATIAMAQGQVLTAGEVYRAPQQGTLTVGSAAGVGTLKAATGGLRLENGDFAEGLTVRAKIESTREDPVRVTGPGNVTFAGGAVTGSVVRVHHGQARLTGGEYALDRIIVATNAASMPSTLTIDGAKIVSTALAKGNYQAYAAAIGGIYGGSGSTCEYPTIGGARTSPARVVLTNGAHWTTVAVTNYNDFIRYGAEYAVMVGGAGYGILEINEGTVFTNRLVVGGDVGDTANYSQGLVIQRGGAVTALGASANTYDAGSYVGGRSYHSGYYEMWGGTLNTCGGFVVGVYGAPGFFAQHGGTVTIGPHLKRSRGRLTIGGTNSGRGHYLIDGGTCYAYDGKDPLAMGQSYCGNTTVMLSIIGEDTLFDLNDLNIHALPNCWDTSIGRATVTVRDGATLRATGFRHAFSPGSDKNLTTPTNHFFYVNFDGGTFKATTANIDIGLSGYATTADYIFKYGVRAFLVGPKGVTIDTDGKTGLRTGVAFKAPEGGVVTGVEGFEPFTVSGVTPPFVEVVDAAGNDKGQGAVIVPLFDSAKMMVTNLQIIAGGTGYVTPKAHFLYEAGSIASKLTCTTGTPVSGSFTKQGEGDFTLMATNTYGGATILKGGTLKLGAPDVLPPGSTIVYQGGELEAAAANCPAALRVTYDGAAQRKAQNVLTFTDGAAPAILPTVTVLGQESNRAWKTRVANGKLHLYYARATTIILR